MWRELAESSIDELEISDLAALFKLKVTEIVGFKWPMDLLRVIGGSHGLSRRRNDRVMRLGLLLEGAPQADGMHQSPKYFRPGSDQRAIPVCVRWRCRIVDPTCRDRVGHRPQKPNIPAISPTIGCRTDFVPSPRVQTSLARHIDSNSELSRQSPSTSAFTFLEAPPRAASVRSAATRAYQPATGSSRLARTASPSLCEGKAGVRPRLYCRGEQPIVLLKAVLKALSDS